MTSAPSTPAAATADDAPPLRNTGGAAVARYSAVVAGAGLLGKPLAVVRDILITRSFGASAATDALFLALALPVGIAAVVAGGGVRVAFQPEFSRRFATDPRQAWRFGLAALLLLVALTGAITAGIILGAGPLAALLTTPEKAGELSGLIRLLAPLLVLFGIQDILTGILHVRLRFFWPAMEAVLRNAAIIAAVVLFAGSGIQSVGYGHLAGTGVLVAACLASAWAAGLRPVWPGREEGTALKALVIAAVPATVGGAIFPICAFIDRSMASWLTAGSVSALAYADSIWQSGMVVAGPVSVVALPVLTGLVTRGETEQFARTVRTSVRGAVFVSVPVATLLIALSEPTVRLLFLRGRFTAEDARMTAQAVTFFALGMPLVVAQGVAMRALQAKGLFNETARLAGIVIGAHVLQNLVLMQLLGHRGLALSYGLSAGLLLWLIDRRLQLPAPGRLAFLARLAAGAVACYSGARAAVSQAPVWNEPLLDEATRLAVGGLGGGAAFLGMSLLLWRSEGLAMIRRLLGRR